MCTQKNSEFARWGLGGAWGGEQLASLQATG